MLTNKLKLLKPHQVNELHSVMTEASIAFEMGASAADVFKKAKHRKVGALRCIYERLEKLNKYELDKVAYVFSKVAN